MATQISYSINSRARLKALAALLALCLAGCGKYGALEPPPDPNAPKPANTSSNPSNMNVLAKPAIPPITPPKQPFFLDFLLK